MDLQLGGTNNHLGHLVDHLGVRQCRHCWRSAITNFKAGLQKTRYAVRKLVIPAFADDNLLVRIKIDRCKRFVDRVLLAPVAFFARHNDVQQLDLCVRIICVQLGYALRDLLLTKLPHGGARRGLVFSKDRIDTPLFVFRNIHLGDVPGAETETIVVVVFNKDDRGAKRHQVRVKFVDLLLKVRPGQMLVHHIGRTFEPFLCLVVSV